MQKPFSPPLLSGYSPSLRRYSGREQAQVRLIGFPWCGAGASVFRKLALDMPAHIELLAVQLPGREDRYAEKKLLRMTQLVEQVIDEIEKKLPPIKTFFVSGGTEMAALFDFARTVARRAERRVVQVNEEGIRKMGEHSMAYLNRLSSLLYALARLANHESGKLEESPTYK